MSKPPVHLGSVDGLRAIAALMVVVYHLYTSAHQPDWRPFMNLNVLRPLHDGWIGVNLFLVLSGFCLFWPHARDPARPFRFGSFMKRRCMRIVPAYYASLILVPLAFWILREAGLWNGATQFAQSRLDAVLHLLLLHSFMAEALQSWNSVTWSLALEWTWYLFFPIAVWMFRKVGACRAVVSFAAITVIYLVTAWLAVGPSPRLGETESYAIRNLLPGRLWEFGMGMLVASWVARNRLPRRLMFLALAAVPILLVMGHAATPVDPLLPVRNTIYGLAFVLLVLTATGCEENPLHRLLQARWMRQIGECSYSLYLFHLPVVVLTTALLALTGLDGVARFFLSLLSLPLIVLLAKWEYWAFEQPFLNAPRQPTAPPIVFPELRPQPPS